MKRVLLTGQEGFIGKSVYKFLSSKKDLETVVINKSYFDNPNWKKDLDELIKKIDTILHVGANSNTLNNNVEYVMFYNYYVSKAIFDSASKYKKPVVYSSSAACEGVSGYPSNLYGWSKYISEQYGLKNNEKFIALRYFNVYGQGEEHKKNMSSIAYQAFKNKEFNLFPNNPKRDFVYIEDVVSATTHSIYTEIESGMYHVGSGVSRSFEDVLNFMNIDYKYLEEEDIPAGYQFHTQADEKLFQPGWVPRFDLESGLKKYREYLL